jgi:hypothetical protein
MSGGAKSVAPDTDALEIGNPPLVEGGLMPSAQFSVLAIIIEYCGSMLVFEQTADVPKYMVAKINISSYLTGVFDHLTI